MLITRVSETYAACWALRKNPRNPFNLCSYNITKWKVLWCAWELRILWEIYYHARICNSQSVAFFFFYAFFYENFQEQISWSSWRFFCLMNFTKNFCSVKKEAQVPKGFFRTSLFLRNKTLPSLIIIENADLRDATEWGALNCKSRLLRFARICNLLRGGMNSLFIEIQ